MRKIDPIRLRNSLLPTVLIMVGGAALGVFIGSVFLLLAGTVVLMTLGPLGFFLYGPLLIAQTAFASLMTLVLVPLWAWLGGWLFAWFSVGKGTSGIANRMGLTLLEEGHPIHVRINELAADLHLPPLRWVGWYEGAEINAFAMGTKRDNALIALSQGAIEKLTKEQLDAVMAHELAHVANNDMARMTYARGVQNALTFFLIFRGLKQIARWMFTPTSQLELMRFSRAREYWADAIAAVLTSPAAMAGALHATDLDKSAPLAQQKPFANLMFSAPAHSWYATHPPLAARIEAVLQGTYINQLPYLDETTAPVSVAGASAH